ncbi:MAG: TetR/AcrR family transcriptional regulator [Solirubrobacterales bacterium]
MVEPATVTREGVEGAQRARILRATGELIAKRGYNDVTVELIIKRARVSFRTFYKGFSGKEDCFLEVFDTAVELTESRVRHALDAEPDAPWPRQVASALTALVEMIAADPIIARACIVEAPTAGSLILSRYVEATGAFVPLFRAGRALNPHGAELPATLEETLSGSVLWSAYQRLIVGEVDRIKALLPELIELVLRPYVGELQAAAVARQALAMGP